MIISELFVNFSEIPFAFILGIVPALVAGPAVAAAVGGSAAGGLGALGSLGGLGGLISGFGGLFGGDDGEEAARIQAAAFQKAIDELRRQFDLTQENISPFLTAGQEAVPGLVQASTAGGLDLRLSELADTDIFGTLVDERTRSVQNQLAAGGQTRSGAGLLEAGKVPTDILLFLEQLTGNRLANLAGSGQNAAIGLGSLGAQSAGQIAGLTGRIGETTAAGLLTDAQADAERSKQLFNLGGTATSLFF